MKQELIAIWANKMVEILTNCPDDKIEQEIEKLKERITSGTIAEIWD